ncbi:MAG: hypothetical protein FWE71_11610 [Nocardioidaceae bacterium]|nr:hypothetical protein [Nocardioidaceae bacterium]MCL2613058.1 hypothetical protein [Nocardioidaceae bacterium]
MQRPDSQASQRAWGWLAALQDGATTPWAEWAAPAEPSLPFFPAAQQLEALRRVNAAAGGRPVPGSVTAALLRGGITDRNRGDLPLADETPRPFGPPAVDPADLPARDLLPVVSGPLARFLAALAEEPVRRPLPLVRGWRMVGDPWATAYLTAAQQRLRRGRTGRRTLVLGADLVTLTVHAWADHAVSGGRLGLRAWLGERVTEGHLPRPLDLARTAGRVAEEVGPRHTVIALDTARVRRLPAPPPVDPTAVELARWVGRPLGVLTGPERRRHLLLHHLLPRATRATGPVTLPSRWQDLLASYADGQRSALAAKGYPVLGSLDALLPSPAPQPTAFPTDRAVLDRAIDLLLEPIEGVSR